MEALGMTNSWIAFGVVVLYSVSESVTAVGTNLTYHACQCPAYTSSCNKKISCVDQRITQIIRLRAFDFGSLVKGSPCQNTGNSTTFDFPHLRSTCTNNFTFAMEVMDLISGRVIGKNVPVPRQCFEPNIAGYFIARFDCVPSATNEPANLELDSLCQSQNLTVRAIRIYSKAFPQLPIDSTLRSCKCTIERVSTEIIIRSYDNRLTKNQALTLSYTNGTVIKEWKRATTLNDVIGEERVSVINSTLFLRWDNHAQQMEGKIWVGIEASAGSITLQCRNSALSTSATSITPPTVIFTTSPTSSAANNRTLIVSASPHASHVTPAAASGYTTISEASISSGLPRTTPIKNTASNSKMSPKMILPGTNFSTGPVIQRTPTGKGNIGSVIGCVIAGVFLLVLLILAVCCLVKRHIKKKKKVSPESNAVHHTENNTDTPNDRMSDQQHTYTYSTHFETDPDATLNATAPVLHQTLPSIFTSQLQAGNNSHNNTGLNGSENDGTTDGNVRHEGKSKHQITASGAAETIYGRPYTIKDDSTFGIKKKKKKKRKKKKRNTIETLLDEQMIS